MFHIFSKSKKDKVHEKVLSLNKKLEALFLDTSLDNNIITLKDLFVDVDILRFRHIKSTHGKQQKYCIAYCDGVVNSSIINDNLIKPLLLSAAAGEGKELIDSLMDKVIMINEAESTNQFQKITEAITYGDTVLFVDGADEAIILNTKGFKSRAISEPEIEKNLTGPREGFTESLLINLSLIRRKVRTNELKIKSLTFGKRTKTKAAVCYIDGIVNKKLLKELYRRLDTIDIDAVLDTNYLTEMIKDAPWSPFRTTGYTERPDVIIGKLLEGRIAVFVDGSPTVMTVPYLFIENFQSSEDYYLSFFYTSYSRLLRILGFILTVSVPGIYIALEGFHHESLPTSFLVNVASERLSVPFPAALEAFFLLTLFDILRETGVRMPSNIGQALSIVGALVVGQAAVDAKLIASPMIIVVATTAITSLLNPKMNAPIIYIRNLILIMSASFGLYGMVLGVSVTIIHLLNLRTLGIEYIPFFQSFEYQDVKDSVFRAPWWQMITRPKLIAADKVRMQNRGDRHE